MTNYSAVDGKKKEEEEEAAVILRTSAINIRILQYIIFAVLQF